MSDLEDTIMQETRRNTSTNKSSYSSTNFTQGTTREDEPEVFEKVEILPNGNWKCRHKCGDKTKLESPF